MPYEKGHFSSEQLLTDAEAARYRQAAIEVGGVAIDSLHKPGEEYRTPRGFHDQVPDGHERVSINGMLPDVQRMNQRRSELEQAQAEQKAA